MIGTILSPAGPSQEKCHRNHLNRGFPFGQTAHRHADFEFRQIFTQARDQNFAAQDDNGGPECPAGDGSDLRLTAAEQAETSSLSAIGSSMRPIVDVCFQMRAR